MFSSPGPSGPPGPAGGPSGPTGPPGARISSVYLASDQSVSPSSFLGLGTEGKSFVTSSIVTPARGVITDLTFSIRDKVLRDGDTVRATIYLAHVAMEHLSRPEFLQR